MSVKRVKGAGAGAAQAKVAAQANGATAGRRRRVVRIAVLHTEAGYCIRPALATAHTSEIIRFINLTGEPVDIELPAALQLSPPTTAIPAGAPAIPVGDSRDATININLLVHPHGIAPERRWQVHYSVFRSKNWSLIPGESTPEIVIDEKP